MGKEIGRSFIYNRSKICTTTLKEPGFSSSANHTSYTINLTRTVISSQLENEDSTTQYYVWDIPPLWKKSKIRKMKSNIF